MRMSTFQVVVVVSMLVDHKTKSRESASTGPGSISTSRSICC
jgi:hypothetical protein